MILRIGWYYPILCHTIVPLAILLYEQWFFFPSPFPNQVGSTLTTAFLYFLCLLRKYPPGSSPSYLR